MRVADKILQGAREALAHVRGEINLETYSPKKSPKLAVTRGSGNVFADLGMPRAKVLQDKAKLAGRIINVFSRKNFTFQSAGNRTGIPAFEFRRIFRAELSGFSVKRLQRFLDALNG